MSRSKAQPQLPIEDKVRMVCYGVDPGVLLGVRIRLLHERPQHDRHEHLELTST
jgi:hypothetical protein